MVRDVWSFDAVRAVLTVTGRGYDPTAARWTPRDDRLYLVEHEFRGIVDPAIEQTLSTPALAVWFAARLVPHVSPNSGRWDTRPTCPVSTHPAPRSVRAAWPDLIRSSEPP